MSGSESTGDLSVEETLGAGHMGGAVRVGNRVRRPAGPWTATVQRFLRHLHDQGIGWAPEPLGRDAQGRDTQAYLSDLVLQYPLPEWVWADEVLADAASFLAQLHQASAGFDTVGAVWRLPAHEPAEVVCHNDFAPYNMVFTENRLTGVVDWDTSSPGPRVWDLAYLAYRLVPLAAPENTDALSSSLAERARRLRLLCDAYGPQVRVAEVPGVVVSRLEDLVDFTRARVDEGNEHLRAHVALYEGDARWVAAHAAELAGPALGTQPSPPIALDPVDGHSEPGWLSAEGDGRPAQPGLYQGGPQVPVVESFRLEVEGELFDVEVDARGGSNYAWVSGPNEGYGFGSSGPGLEAPTEQHEESIRGFLSMIDRATGYIAEE